MFSVTNTGMNFRPLCTANVCPTRSGRMVERRDHVFTTFFWFCRFMSSTFLIRWRSMNGPFLTLRAMSFSFCSCRGLKPEACALAHSLVAPLDDELGGALVDAGLVALGGLAPGADRVRIALPRL